MQPDPSNVKVGFVNPWTAKPSQVGANLQMAGQEVAADYVNPWTARNATARAKVDFDLGKLREALGIDQSHGLIQGPPGPAGPPGPRGLQGPPGTGGGGPTTLLGDATGVGVGTVNTTVRRIQGRAVSNVAPLAGQVYAWNVGANQFEPTTVAGGGGGGIGEAPPDGQLYVRDGQAQDWVVATSLDAVPEPTVAGNFLRTNTGTWVEGVPLTSLPLSVANGGTNAATVAGAWSSIVAPGGVLATVTGLAGGGAGLDVTTTNTTAASWAIRVTNQGTAGIAGRGIHIINAANGIGLNVIMNGTGFGANFTNNSTSHCAYFSTGPSGQGIYFQPAAANPALEMIGVGPVLPNGARRFSVYADGSVVVGPSPLASQGAGTVNVADGFYVNNVKLEIPTLPLSVANGGIPAGGAINTYLAKTTAADRAVEWRVLGQLGAAGAYNTAAGANALGAVTTGNSNTGFGVSALLAVQGGMNNTAFGIGAGGGTVNSNGNTSIGSNAGRFITNGITAATDSANSVFVGSGSRSLAQSQTNEIVIGANAGGRGSNTVTLGTDAITQLWCGGMDLLAEIAALKTAVGI